jgi:hypothetical protein
MRASTLRTEVYRAKEAYEFLKCSGYPSPDEAIYLFQDGNIVGAPDLNREDLIRAYNIYGIPIAYVQKKMTRLSRGCADCWLWSLLFNKLL